MKRRKEIQSICAYCAKKSGGQMPPEHIATWSMGVCGVCNKEGIVTEPRDYGLRVFSNGRLA